jgi:hypothetical protein
LQNEQHRERLWSERHGLRWNVLCLFCSRKNYLQLGISALTTKINQFTGLCTVFLIFDGFLISYKTWLIL